MSQDLGCHTLNMHEDMCLQRNFVLAYFWSRAWAQLRKPIGAFLPPWAENLILEVGIKGVGGEWIL